MGVVSKSLTGLTKGTTYYYTTKVNNSGGNALGDGQELRSRQHRLG